MTKPAETLLDIMGKEYALSPDELRRAQSHPPRRAGYAHPPGTGPAGETCATCKHIVRTDKYRKCRLREGAWTHGFATDILARSPACKSWEKPE